MANKPIKVKMEFAKSTKNTHVFHAVDDDAPLSSIYVSKSDMKDASKAILVTVEETTLDAE